MFRAFFLAREWRLWAYGGASILMISLWLQVQLTVLINTWYGGFYNHLQTASKWYDNSQAGIDILYSKILSTEYVMNGLVGDPSFFEIATPYVIIAVFTGWFTRIYGLRWRQAMTFNYIPRWRNVKEDIEGSSQRIQEDCNRFARLVESLGLQMVRAVMTLIAFIPILWALSANVEIPLLVGIEGSLVWIALAVSLGGLVVSWFVGWKLPGLEYNNQKAEAAFRKELVLGEDDKVKYSHPKTLKEMFERIRKNYQRLYMHYGYFDGWMNSYDQVMIIVPYLIMAPSLFTGTILLGILIQVSNAFQKVHGGFALFLHNWTTITELRSIYKRLREFEVNLVKQGV